MKQILFALFLIIFSTTSSYSITRNWDGGGDQHTWTDPLNWDCNCLPGINDMVIIFSPIMTTVNIPTGSNIHIHSLNSYQHLTIATGAILEVDYIISLTYDGELINNGSIYFNGEAIEIREQHNFINNGTINMQVPYNELYINGSGLSPATFTNHGNINFNALNQGYLRTTGVSTFTNAADGTITFLHAYQRLIINSGTFINQGIITGKGNIFNQSTFTNASSGIINMALFTENGITNNGTFNNEGAINISNPGAGALNSLYNAGTYAGNGSIDFSGNDLIYNSGTCTISGSSLLLGNQDYGGIVNSGTLSFNNETWQLDIYGRIWNTATGSITIATCKELKSTGKFQNDGSFTNLGYLVLKGSGAYAYISTGTFTNQGVLSSDFGVPIIEPTGNTGVHFPKIFGQQCTGTPLVFFYTGTLNNINNNPTGMYTTPALTTSAGSFDYLTRTFTPNAACHNLTKLYISLQKTGCASVAIPITFELPIYAPTTYYADTDFDGYGDLVNSQLVTCSSQPYGYVTNSTDCDDTNPNVYPGAPETCNDKDYNCDGIISGINPTPTWYRDADFDGYGNASMSVIDCSAPYGYVANNTDCDDSDYFIHPGAAEQCNNKDDDCDGLIDEDFTPTVLTFDGSTSSDWYDATNWTPTMVPGYCVDVIIPAGMIVLVEKVPTPPDFPEHALCRSLTIANTASVTVINPLDITGGTVYGISNAGTLNLINDSYTNIQFINGNGLENTNTMTISDDAFIYVSSTTQNCIRNTLGAIFNVGVNSRLDLNDALESAIYNSGTIHRNGFINITNITGNVIRNEGIFNNQGDMLINGFELPGWFIENLSGGVFNNLATKTIAFPVPGGFYNVSDMGIINQSGSTFNNYGILQFFGHRIAGDGAFIQHAGSIVQGCLPGLGCP